MRRAANWVLGWCELEAVGGDREEFLNLCARRDIPFWDVRWGEDRVALRTSLPGAGRALEVGRGGRWQVRRLRRGGLPGLLYSLRYRWGLFAGMGAALLAVTVLSQFVLTIRVSGNVKVPTEAILTQLRVQGVRVGAFGPGLDTRDAAHGVILELPELSWVAINLHGTLADVLVREGRPRPELVEEDVPAHITARYTGIITHMEVTRGMALVKEGDTVVAGDTLISSWVDFPEPEGAKTDAGGILVRASGRVVARTWHTLEAVLPLEGDRKEYTGGEKVRWSLEILGREVKFYRNSSIPQGKYDTITTYHTARLPGGQALPLSLKKETLRAYETAPCPIDRERGETLLKSRLRERLDALVGTGEILRTDYRTRYENGVMRVTLLAECRQDIGQTVEDGKEQEI